MLARCVADKLLHFVWAFVCHAVSSCALKRARNDVISCDPHDGDCMRINFGFSGRQGGLRAVPFARWEGFSAGLLGAIWKQGFGAVAFDARTRTRSYTPVDRRGVTRARARKRRTWIDRVYKIVRWSRAGQAVSFNSGFGFCQRRASDGICDANARVYAYTLV